MMDLPPERIRPALLLCLPLLWGAFLPAPAQEVYSNPVITPQAHDPSVIRTADGTFWLYSPEDAWGDGRGQRHVSIFKSRDLVDWVYIGDAFDGPPGWKPRADYWAVDVHEYEGIFYLYYPAWDYTFIYDPNPCIGVAISYSPEGPWTDLGRPLFCSFEVGVGNSIDPFVWVEGQRRMLVWGSFLGIYAAELTADGSDIIGTPTLLADGPVEGAYIHQRDGSYYLFASAGTCCFGPLSTYKVRVGRADSVTGPYLNREGADLRDELGALVVAGDGVWAGPGHNAVATDDAGDDWLLYHAIPRDDPWIDGLNSHRVLLIDRIDWLEGWPEVRGGKPSSSPQTAPAVDLDLRVALTPTTSTRLPRGGGEIGAELRIENSSDEVQKAEVWLEVRLPGGETITRVDPMMVSLAPREQREVMLSWTVDAEADWGTWWVHVAIGDHPGVVEDYGAFEFQKSK